MLYTHFTEKLLGLQDIIITNVKDNSFLPIYHRMTNRLSVYVIDKLCCECSFTSVAREVNLSVSTVIRVLDLVSYSSLTACGIVY